MILEEEDVGMDEGLQEGAETERRTGTPIGQGNYLETIALLEC